MLNFLLDERGDGRCVSNADLQAKAVSIARNIEGFEDFKASNGWLTRWKRRNQVGIRRGTNESQKLPRDFRKQVLDFKQDIDSKRRQHNYATVQIGNIDQTQCRFDMPPTSTKNKRGESTVRISASGGSKRGFTVALTALASGRKLPAYVVFKEPTGRIPPRVFADLHIPGNIRLTCTKNGWMTTEKMTDWAKRVWRENQDDVRRLLVLDQAPIHKTAATRNAISETDTDLVFIPAGCTSLCQPADVSWNRPFKLAMRKQWKDYRKRNLKTTSGNLKTATRQDVIDWVSRAWHDVSMDTIIHSFKTCALSLPLDGSEDGLIHDRLAEAMNDIHGEDARAAEMVFASDSDGDNDDFSGFSASDSE